MELKNIVSDLVRAISDLPNVEEKIEAINYARAEIHKISPMSHNPIDFVEWVKAEKVFANDYNPNSVAPPEMRLLKLSIEEDGYTQPIVADKENEDRREIVDGFHRNRCGREYSSIREVNFGYLPLSTIRRDRKDKSNRMASTIRHNRARGVHSVRGMSDIVINLVRDGWSDLQIAKQLEMELEEVIRLKQISGLPEAFANHEFSKSWSEFERKFDEKYANEGNS